MIQNDKTPDLTEHRIATPKDKTPNLIEHRIATPKARLLTRNMNKTSNQI